MTAFPKPIKREKVRRAMRKIGKVGKRRLEANKRRKPLADEITWCEIRPVLRNRGITFRNCIDLDDLTWAHSVKHRGDDPILENECARSCKLHHYYVLDLLEPALTAEIVREAIARRN